MSRRTPDALPLYPLGIGKRGPVIAAPQDRPYAQRRLEGWTTLSIILASACISVAALGALADISIPVLRRIWRAMPVESQFALVMALVFCAAFWASHARIGLLWDWRMARRDRRSDR